MSDPVVVASKSSVDRAVADRVRAFAKWLRELGYTPASMRQRLQLSAALLRWMAARKLPLTDLSEAVVIAALRQRRRGPVSNNRRRALFHFLEHLRDLGVIPQVDHSDRSPRGQLEQRYVSYLRAERGLVHATIVNYRGVVRRFLFELPVDSQSLIAAVSPSSVTRFLLRHLRTISPRRAQLLGCALRSFLRFLFLDGETPVDLSLAVPTVRQFRKATLPRYVAPDDVERIVAACDLRTPGGRRDKAVLLLLARLGLRAIEIVRLDLDDVHWREGELIVRGKGDVRDRLPLPKDVGVALTRYLKKDRARCASRRLFLRMRAPNRGFHSVAAVTTLVARAIARSGVRSPHRGAHLLRHSLATGMIQRGAAMTEIAQLLRHRSSNTTELYAKVDLQQLRDVALPWSRQGGRR